MRNENSKPVNKTAAIVTQKAPKDSVYEVKEREGKINVNYWENPRLMFDTPRNPSFTDMTGVKFGRMLVIGYLGKGKWQCKCQCGRYVPRKTSTLSREAKQREDLCYECYQFTALKRNEHYRKTGEHLPDDYDYFA